MSVCSGKNNSAVWAQFGPIQLDFEKMWRCLLILLLQIKNQDAIFVSNSLQKQRMSSKNMFEALGEVEAFD